MRILLLILNLFYFNSILGQSNVFNNTALEVKVVKLVCIENCGDPLLRKYRATDTLQYGGALRDGDPFKISIVNHSAKRQYYSLVDMGPAGDISLIFPMFNEDPEYYIIEPKTTLTINTIINVAPPFGVDKLILISGETARAGYWLKTLQEWQDTIQPESRGMERRNPRQFLQEMVWIMDGKPSVKFNECFFSLFNLATLPKKEDGAFALPRQASTSLSAVNKFQLLELFDVGCLDKKKSDNLFKKFPIVDVYQPLITYSTRGADPTDVETKTFVIKGSSTAEKGTRQVLVNGDQASLTKTSEKGERFAWSKEVELFPGKNSFTVISTTSEGFSNCEEFILNYNEKDGKVSGVGHNYSFFIGINQYANMPKLNCGQKDAKDVRNLLLSQYQFEPGYSFELYDERATQDNIDSVFRLLIDKLTPADNLVVYYAGHGILDKQFKGVGYWIPVDARRFKAGDYIPNYTIKNYIETLKAKHVLIFADACFSGSFFNIDRDVKFIEKLDAIKSRWLFCSGREEVVSDCMPNKHNSPFANYLVEFLSNYKGDGMTTSALYQLMSPAVTNNSNQTPIAGPVRETGDEGGEFVFKRKK